MPKKILIVEDEQPIAKAMSLKLDHAGFEANTAVNGQDALNKLLVSTYDLILLDLIMPVMDGFAVLETLQQQHSTIPVIVTSNLGQKEDMDKAKLLGAQYFLIKADTGLHAIVDQVKTVLGL